MSRPPKSQSAFPVSRPCAHHGERRPLKPSACSGAGLDAVARWGRAVSDSRSRKMGPWAMATTTTIVAPVTRATSHYSTVTETWFGDAERERCICRWAVCAKGRKPRPPNEQGMEWHASQPGFFRSKNTEIEGHANMDFLAELPSAEFRVQMDHSFLS